MSRPLVIVDPAPRRRELIFSDRDWARLLAQAEVVYHGDEPLSEAEIDRQLPRAAAIIGQTSLSTARLQRAAKLAAVFNVEGNFLPNIDYPSCFDRGIHVLSVSPVFAPQVAEMALALGLDLARGISAADREFRAGAERYGFAGNQQAFSLHGCHVGIVGYGDLARAFRPLLVPFGCPVKVCDPWLPDSLLREAHCTPVALDDLLSTSQLVFVFAAVTTENRGFLGREQLERLRPDAGMVLVSRADVVDFAALVELLAAGRFRAAIDVFPEEPMPAAHPVRQLPNAVLTAHRAGAMREVYRRMGEFVVDDLELILRGLPPVRCKRGQRETVGRLRSRPIAAQTQQAQRQ